MNRMKFLILIPIIVTIGVLAVINSEDPKPQPSDQNENVTSSSRMKRRQKPQEVKEVSKKSNPKQGKHSPKNVALKANGSPRETIEEELKRVRVLATQLPESRVQLLEIITSEDPLKQKEIKPHSMDEIQQNKRGAVKVLALKALMQLKDKKMLQENLGQIIATAKDPTIRKIAKAAKDSMDQGRSLFEDFPEAVQSESL